MSRPWSDLIDFIAPFAPDVPDSLVEQVTKWAAIRLCERSGLFKEELFFDSQCGVSDYPLELDSCWVPHTVYSVCVNGNELSPQPIDACCNSSCSRVYTLYDPRHINIRPTPNKDEVDGIRILLSTKPSVDSCDIIDQLYDDWSEVITAGALERLYRMPRKPWSSLTAAREYEKDFRAGVGRAQIRAYKGYTRGGVRLRARPFVPADRRGVFISGVR